MMKNTLEQGLFVNRINDPSGCEGFASGASRQNRNHNFRKRKDGEAICADSFLERNFSTFRIIIINCILFICNNHNGGEGIGSHDCKISTARALRVASILNQTSIYPEHDGKIICNVANETLKCLVRMIIYVTD